MVRPDNDSHDGCPEIRYVNPDLVPPEAAGKTTDTDAPVTASTSATAATVTGSYRSVNVVDTSANESVSVLSVAL
ncbi:MAG: hypothetical protein OXI18_11680 [bacterium]|nr:hypothetical protein [bacterium]